MNSQASRQERTPVQVNAPGYAGDSLETNIAPDQRATQNMRLLYVTPVDGVDWAAGKIRAVGVRMPPKNAANPTVSREMAKRAPSPMGSET